MWTWVNSLIRRCNPNLMASCKPLNLHCKRVPWNRSRAPLSRRLRVDLNMRYCLRPVALSTHLVEMTSDNSVANNSRTMVCLATTVEQNRIRWIILVLLRWYLPCLTPKCPTFNVDPTIMLSSGLWGIARLLPWWDRIQWVEDKDR